MTDPRKGTKTQRLSIRESLTRAWLLFTLLSSLFTLPAFAQLRTTGGSASSIKPNIITIITDDQGW
ncbi:MAG: hypothetical protein ACPHYF_10875, partial [Akkermansiaceae bacterium]